MGDERVDGVGGHGVVQGYAAAQDLLAVARREAAAIVAEAERRAGRREQEAELLVAKARRVLMAAEERAAVIVAEARADGAGTAWIDLDDDPVPAGRVIAPNGARLRSGTLGTRIERMVATAIADAVDEAFPLHDAG